VILWLWDASGPGHCAGVTDDQAKAREAAEACIASGQASSARVEGAHLVLGLALTSVYERTGVGWVAQCRDSGVSWVPSQGTSWRRCDPALGETGGDDAPRAVPACGHQR
jgi:hypothetical protein